jgi:Flp pilus assembly protein TadG
MKRPRVKGQSLVETTLVLAAFMGLLLGMVGVGGTLFARQILAARVHEAARWGAVNTYDPTAIRNVVLYGTAKPEKDAQSFIGLSAADVGVAQPGCPGADCRVSVDIPQYGIRSVELIECEGATCGVPAKPSGSPRP